MLLWLLHACVPMYPLLYLYMIVVYTYLFVHFISLILHCHANDWDGEVVSYLTILVATFSRNLLLRVQIDIYTSVDNMSTFIVENLKVFPTQPRL